MTAGPYWRLSLKSPSLLCSRHHLFDRSGGAERRWKVQMPNSPLVTLAKVLTDWRQACESGRIAIFATLRFANWAG